MAERVIRQGRVQQDDWTLVTKVDAGALPHGKVILPMAMWRGHHAQLTARERAVGVWLGPDDAPEELARDVATLPLIAVHFPKLADGRGYSSGAVLRRLGYRGELRAFGDIGRDQLLFLRRCGFDAFVLGEGRDPYAALAAFHELTVSYQGSVEDPRPLFRRRLANHG
jgi:uncharacterized protein (DUF934 family)